MTCRQCCAKPQIAGSMDNIILQRTLDIILINAHHVYIFKYTYKISTALCYLPLRITLTISYIIIFELKVVRSTS